MWSRSVFGSVCCNDPPGSLDFVVGDMGCLQSDRLWWIIYIYKYIFIHILYFMFVVTVYTFDSS